MRPLEYSQSQTCRGSAPWTMTPEQKALLDGYIAAEGLLRPKPKEEPAPATKQNAALERFLSRNMGSVKKIIN